MIKYMAVYTLEDNVKRVITFEAYSIPDAYKRFETLLDGKNWELLAITVDSTIISQYGHLLIVLK